jgi:ABC-type transport system involved in Fe-S cluster assembly fused permease/ATPase subunit
MHTLTHAILGARMLRTLHVLSPAAVVVAYCITSLAYFFGSKKPLPEQENNGGGKWLRIASLVLTALVMVTYISESILLACVLPSHAATTSDDNLVFTLFSSLVWLILLLGLVDTASSDIRQIFSAAWIFAVVFDIAFLVLGSLMPQMSGNGGAIRLFWQTLRVTILLVLVGIAVGKRSIRHTRKASDEEIAPLLARIESHLTSSGGHHMNGNAYGTTSAGDSKKADTKDSDGQNGDNEYEDSDDEDEDNAGKGKLKKNWWVYIKAFAIFLPHLWPRKSFKLQLHFPALGLCLLACRALNVLVPLQIGMIVDVLRRNGGSVPWVTIGLFVLLRFLDSSAGISLIQSWLWMPINKYTSEELSAAAYDKVMNLSCDFHDSKKSGRMWRIVARGDSLSDLVQTIGFEMIPMAADLAIAVSVFWWLFDAYMAFIVALSSVVFLWATAKTIPIRTKRQREYIKAWEDEYTQMTESSLNWTTVSYFNRIRYEQKRHKDAVSNSQRKLIRYRALSFITSALRALTLQTGLMAAAMLAAYQISKGDRSVGDFVVLITYWTQLTYPLAYFANGFSRIAKSLVDAEKLLELLQTKPTVGNNEGATELVLKQGQVDFDRVCFSYDGQRQVAKSLSFRAEPGQTVAFVGETGGGKSTILKLLFRFYDATSGTVMIDGQDVRHVTLESLRANIGCVPQDPILFNQTIMQNLQYAKLDATEEEVQAACKAVALHDKIVSFTKGYSEKVGERGVKLSGGELQRMAIARAILKDPKILLLDEATSSVDSETEALIQTSLKRLCAGRTTFVIAHRLSTIIHADLVMVIKNGQIIERGTHDKLMNVNGHYSKLWTRQLHLQTGEERSRSRSRSPEKTTVLVDDVTDSDIESRKGLLKKKKHENRGSEEDYGSSGHNHDGKKSTGPVMDAKVRGRSPRRNDKAWERFDSMRRKIMNSKSPRHKDVNGSEEMRSQSHSPARTRLKPEAPEFVPQEVQRDVPYLSLPPSSSQKIDDQFEDGLHVSQSRVTAEGSLTEAADAQKENSFSCSEPSKAQSSSSLPALAQGKITRFGFHVPNGERRKKTRSSNTSAKSSNTELAASEGITIMAIADSRSELEANTHSGGSEQNLSESRRTNQKRQGKKSKYGKQMFNSRRNISKSEPQGRNQVDGSADQDDNVEVGSSSPGPGWNAQNAPMGRRRSSAPNIEALTAASPVVQQNSHAAKGIGAADHPSGTTTGGPRHREMTDVDEERELVAPANSPAGTTRK